MGLAKAVAARFPDWGPEFVTLMARPAPAPGAPPAPPGRHAGHPGQGPGRPGRAAALHGRTQRRHSMLESGAQGLIRVGRAGRGTRARARARGAPERGCRGARR